MKQEEIVKAILNLIRKETGYTKEATFGIGFHELFKRSEEILEDNKIKIVFEDHFEEDGFSQYPKSHILEGYVILDNDGIILDWDLKETYTGPASTLESYKGKKENEEK